MNKIEQNIITTTRKLCQQVRVVILCVRSETSSHQKMSSSLLLLPSPSSQHSPLLLRCLDILKVENTLRNATSSNIDCYSSSSFSFTSLLNAFEESFSSDSIKEDRICVLPYFFPLASRTLRRCFLISVDGGTIKYTE